MKKYKKIAYISLIIILITFGFIVYKVSGKEEKSDIKEKANEEIKYIDGKLTNLFNEINNIKFNGYTISATDISQNDTSIQNEEQSSNSTSSSSSNDSGSSASSPNSSEKKQGNEKQKEYTLKETGILNNKEEINWEEIKKEVENLYPSLSSMTIDLYKTSINQQEILGFNNEFDNLINAVKNEDKEATLDELSKLYNYIPKFKQSCSDTNLEIIISNTKNYLFKAYSILDSEKWNNISANINEAIQEYTKLVTDIENKNNKQYNINKAYIMINEMQNAIKLEDKEVFLIKYKNLLEELENI